ncbi:MAG TPA: phage tail protein [Blastocatellia bacterium]|nr:phage tail protein [Blastocatellia bacterium]
MSSDPQPSGELLKYLPAVFHADDLLADYLSAFEQILIGASDPPLRSLEATIAGISNYFNPKEAPEEFLPWLAGWMAFGMRADLPVNLQREFLAQVISLYKKRGTSDSMKQLLRIFTGAEPTILEGDDLADTKDPAWNVADGYQKWAGVDADGKPDGKGDGKPEHAFGVLLSFMDKQGGQDRTAPEIQRKLIIAYALIELEKPAHTIFYLVPVFPSLRLPDFSAGERAAGQTDPKAHSRIGFNTLLGVRSTK